MVQMIEEIFILKAGGAWNCREEVADCVRVKLQGERQAIGRLLAKSQLSLIEFGRVLVT